MTPFRAILLLCLLCQLIRGHTITRNIAEGALSQVQAAPVTGSADTSLESSLQTTGMGGYTNEQISASAPSSDSSAKDESYRIMAAYSSGSSVPSSLLSQVCARHVHAYVIAVPFAHRG